MIQAPLKVHRWKKRHERELHVIRATPSPLVVKLGDMATTGRLFFPERLASPVQSPPDLEDQHAVDLPWLPLTSTESTKFVVTKA
jgi:hypothetical protein